jgi:divalent metal cation (Fe/Co/Zn/Cd) transporter
MGESVSESLANQIQDAIQKADSSIQRESVHHLHVHDYGEHKELTAHIRLPADMKIDDAHDIVTKIEKAIREELKLEITIHVEPSPPEKKDKESG